MKYSCVCPDRVELTDEQIKDTRKENRKKLSEIENSLANGLEGKSYKEIKESIRQQLLEHFKHSAFNACENQE